MVHRAAVAALALALLVSGCMSGGGMSGDAKRLQEQSAEAMQDVDRYRFDMTGEVDTDRQSVVIDATGLLDRPDRKGRIDMEITGPRNMDMLTYIDGNTAYARIGGSWRSIDVAERDIWDQNNQLERQRELLEASRLRITGNDTVDGVPVRVVEMEVPEDRMDEVTGLLQQSGAGNVDAEVRDFSSTAYVARDSKLMRQMELKMTMAAEGQTMDVAITMTFSNFGTDADITIPEAAKDDATTYRLAPAAG